MEKQELIDWICDLFQIEQCPQQILGQIHKFTRERGYSYKDIARALAFYVEVDGGKLEPKYGIGIVPFVMERAQAYFKKLELEKEQQRRAAQTHKKENRVTTTISCTVNQKKPKRKQIDISQID